MHFGKSAFIEEVALGDQAFMFLLNMFFIGISFGMSLV